MNPRVESINGMSNEDDVFERLAEIVRELEEITVATLGNENKAQYLWLELEELVE